MFVSRAINTSHADVIHDVAYDFYGRRMATCSSDQMIKIWDLLDNGDWVCSARWRCHLGSAWRVTWAHPEFGQVIATCSFDRTIAIWEEIIGPPCEQGEQGPEAPESVDANRTTSSTTAAVTSGNTTASQTTSHTTCNASWVRRAYLVDPRTAVTGLQFAPRQMGLQLAAVSTDGIVRIYEAMDVMNLSQWRLQFDFGTKMAGSCLAWSQSRLDPPLIAVGSTGASGVQLQSGGVTDSSASCGPGTLSGQPTESTAVTSVANPQIVSGKLVLYEYSETVRHWDLVEDVQALTDPIYDVAFAPHMGQSYHTLAVGSMEVIILRIKSTDARACTTAPTGDGNSVVDATGTTVNRSSSSGAYQISQMAKFDHHKGRVWRVSWNMTGSVLASSGDDGCVRLWQANFLGLWQPISVLCPNGGGPSVDANLSDQVGSRLPFAVTNEPGVAGLSSGQLNFQKKLPNTQVN